MWQSGQPVDRLPCALAGRTVVGPMPRRAPRARPRRPSRKAAWPLQTTTRGGRRFRSAVAKPPDALDQRAARRRHAQGRGPPQFGERRQSPGIIERAAASQRRRVVAAVFSLDANATRHPGDRRMIEEHGLHDVLHEVDQIIVPANVDQLVRENGLELGGSSVP